ncbi:DUF402 domain-containing protein [Streptomyces sp. NBC_00829]|uniref:DUF402 domain-containing protein n=1 Tax=Streptomyces sp. NBC_00829 TaxID=2903679 RepID=UPI003868F9F3|nr:DUF402 domain-containing protein [Streptomyces sp. NBC_00829]
MPTQTSPARAGDFFTIDRLRAGTCPDPPDGPRNDAGRQKGNSSLFAKGQTVVRRGLYPDGRIAYVQSGRVVADNDRGLLVWTAAGSTTMRRVALDGTPTRHWPRYLAMSVPTMLAPATWESYGTLMLTPPGTQHSVWWSFDRDGTFAGWYVNLETDAGRWPTGTDHIDHALDLLIDPDRRTWRWKDDDEFTDLTGRPGFWDTKQAAGIRAEGGRMPGLATAEQFPFDGTWSDFRPEPAWQPSTLPSYWDQPPTFQGQPL